NADGTLDKSFNGTGEVFDNFPGADPNFTDENIRGIAIQPDGKIVATGNFVGAGFRTNVAVLRYNADGSLDTTFNGSGRTSFEVPGSDDAGQGIAVQADGKIVVAGHAQASLVLRYNPDGTPDNSFGPGGAVLGSADVRLYSTSLQADGKIVVGGTSANG